MRLAEEDRWTSDQQPRKAMTSWSREVAARGQGEPEHLPLPLEERTRISAPTSRSPSDDVLWLQGDTGLHQHTLHELEVPSTCGGGICSLLAGKPEPLTLQQTVVFDKVKHTILIRYDASLTRTSSDGPPSKIGLRAEILNCNAWNDEKNEWDVDHNRDTCEILSAAASIDKLNPHQHPHFSYYLGNQPVEHPDKVWNELQSFHAPNDAQNHVTEEHTPTRPNLEWYWKVAQLSCTREAGFGKQNFSGVFRIANCNPRLTCVIDFQVSLFENNLKVLSDNTLKFRCFIDPKGLSRTNPACNPDKVPPPKVWGTDPKSLKNLSMRNPEASFGSLRRRQQALLEQSDDDNDEGIVVDGNDSVFHPRGRWLA
ncbi:hypothetical protein T439DRAFT_352318 [Meredithblackwellia eburnea MCA 4105]